MKSLSRMMWVVGVFFSVSSAYAEHGMGSFNGLPGFGGPGGGFMGGRPMAPRPDPRAMMFKRMQFMQNYNPYLLSSQNNGWGYQWGIGSMNVTPYYGNTVSPYYYGSTSTPYYGSGYYPTSGYSIPYSSYGYDDGSSGYTANLPSRNPYAP